MYILYYLGDMEQSFACASQGFPQKNEIIKLYLSSDDLVRSTHSVCYSYSHASSPCAKPVTLYSVQIPSAVFRLGEVKFYINNNPFYSIPLGSILDLLSTLNNECTGKEAEILLYHTLVLKIF